MMKEIAQQNYQIDSLTRQSNNKETAEEKNEGSNVRQNKNPTKSFLFLTEFSNKEQTNLTMFLISRLKARQQALQKWYP